MKTYFLIFLPIIVLFFPVYCLADEILCTELYLPFVSFENRRSYYELCGRASDGFGAYRRRGHKHAGLDIRADFNETVYAVGKGKVVKIFNAFPYKSVLLEHRLATGDVFYTVYIHIEDVLVSVGDRVDQNTPLARVFNQDEFKKSKFIQNHLHFEIRKTIDDYRLLSIRCRTLEDLAIYFYDPMKFFQEYLEK